MEGVMPHLIRRRIALALTIMFGATACREQLAIAEDVLSPLIAIPIAGPNPVLGADDKTHLAYEIVLMNMGSGFIVLEEINALDAESGAVLGTLEGEGLARMLRLNGDSKGIQLPAGGSGIMFMDVTLDQGAALPKALKHRFAMAVS